MPIYEYQCSKCKGVIEELVGLDEDIQRDTSLSLITCCGISMNKIISATPGVVKGGASPNVALNKRNLHPEGK